jgi:hypothetical protein
MDGEFFLIMLNFLTIKEIMLFIEIKYKYLTQPSKNIIKQKEICHLVFELFGERNIEKTRFASDSIIRKFKVTRFHEVNSPEYTKAVSNGEKNRSHKKASSKCRFGRSGKLQIFIEYESKDLEEDVEITENLMQKIKDSDVQLIEFNDGFGRVEHVANIMHHKNYELASIVEYDEFASGDKKREWQEEAKKIALNF